MLLTRKKINYYRYSNKNYTYHVDGMKLRVDNDRIGRRFVITPDDRKENKKILDKMNDDINKLRNEERKDS